MLRWFTRELNRLQEVKRDERGFTLIELLVVIIIIGILAAIAIPTFLAQRERSWEATARSDMRNAATAATACSSANGGSYANCAAVGPVAGDDNDLIEFGFNPSDNVTVNGLLGDADEWSGSMQHANGGAAFTFATFGADAGQTTEAARGTGPTALTP